MNLDPKDLVIDTVLTKIGGGFAPLRENGVKVLHVPTGISVTVTTERSQHRNRQIALERLDKLVASLNQLATPAQSAKQRYSDLQIDKDESDPVERLRAFCSLAMNGQDWLDVEPFFAALAQPSQTRGLTAVQIAAVEKSDSFTIPVYAAPQPSQPVETGEACGDLFAEISVERTRQNDQWGGASHDDEHTTEDFFGFMRRQMDKARQKADSVGHEIHHMRLSIDELGPQTRIAYRSGLVKIAALAVAAIESIDRKSGVATPSAKADYDFDAMDHQVLFGYDRNGDAVFGTDPEALRKHHNQSAPVLDDERAAFEACLKSGVFDVERMSDFHNCETEAAWRGWQARAASPQATATQPAQTEVPPDLMDRVDYIDAQGYVHWKQKAELSENSKEKNGPEGSYVDRLDPAELQITTYPTQVGGGFAPLQMNGVKVLHVPTGISVECSSERSAHKNRHRALTELAAILEKK